MHRTGGHRARHYTRRGMGPCPASRRGNRTGGHRARPYTRGREVVS